jgi:hypothetical protein
MSIILWIKLEIRLNRAALNLCGRLPALKIFLDGIIRNQYKPGTECVYSGKRNTVKFRDGPAAVIGNICFFNTPLRQREGRKKQVQCRKSEDVPEYHVCKTRWQRVLQEFNVL